MQDRPLGDQVGFYSHKCRLGPETHSKASWIKEKKNHIKCKILVSSLNS